MKSKLTLTVDKNVIDSAKQMARRKGTSVSFMFEQWAMRMASREESGSSMETLAGLWRENSGEDMDLDQVRLEALLEKHDS